MQPEYLGPFEPVHACRRMETRHCPVVYEGVCGDRPCARFESDDETPWLPEIMEDAMSRPLVVLDRVTDVKHPDYCVHGRATCVACGEWVWLGSETSGTVTRREADPLCMRCAHKHVPAGQRPSGNIRDHRRADGPHDA